MCLKGLKPDLILPTWNKVYKQWPGSKPIWDQLGPFQNEKGQNYFERVWILTPFSNMDQDGKAEVRCQTPFGTNLTPFKMKRTRMILKRFGTPPHMFHHRPKWKIRGQVPNPVGTSVTPFKMKWTKIILNEFGT